jgi:hypothetical protein
MRPKAPKQNPLTLLPYGFFLSLSGAFSGALIAFGYDFYRAKRIFEAIANPSLESVLDSSSQTQSALDEDCKT